MMPIKEMYEKINHFRRTVPVDVEGLAWSLGVKVQRTFLSDNISGLIYKSGPDRYEIAVNAKHPETRQRFTIAHELGHFVLHRSVMGDRNVDDCAYRSDGSVKNNKIGPREETEANKFAANLLMPAEAIADIPSTLPTIAAAKKFKVSEGAMKIRLRR
jgi:Zn-dependent peptidase ImmA (M78 family)